MDVQGQQKLSKQIEIVLGIIQNLYLRDNFITNLKCIYMVNKTHASCGVKDMNYYNICCPLMIGTADQLTHTMMTSFKNIPNIKCRILSLT